MNTHYIQTVTDPTIKTVTAVFEYEDIMAKRYTYKTCLENLKEGDMAVVNTPHGLSIVQIVEVHDEPEIDPDSRIDFKWIVQKVDKEAIEQAEADDKVFAKKCRERIRSNHRKQAKLALEGLLGEGFIESVSEDASPKRAGAENRDESFDEYPSSVPSVPMCSLGLDENGEDIT